MNLVQNYHRKCLLKKFKNHENLFVKWIFYTKNKEVINPLGIEYLKEINTLTNIPWFAIGGINKKNISYLKNNGFSKFALVSELMNSDDPKDQAIMILKELSHEN